MRSERRGRITLAGAVAALCVLITLLTPTRDADAKRRQAAMLAVDESNPNPVVTVRLGIAPPWRVVVGSDARVDDTPLAPGAYTVSWQGDALRLEGGGTRREGAPLTLTATDPIAINGHRYRGALVFRRWSVLDRLPLDSYLKGVVGCEIGTNAEPEAMKAQAVVARTYTLGHLTAEIADDTSFQVYRGLDAENDAVSRAVDETSGQVVTFEGRLAREVCYHSTCGGHTESNEYVFLTPPVAYLRGVPCTVPIPAPAATGESSGGDAPTPVATAEASAQEPVAVLEARALGARSLVAPVGVPAVGMAAPPVEVGASAPAATVPAAATTREADRAATTPGQLACEKSSWAHWKICWPASAVPEIAILKTSPNGRVLQVRVGGRVFSGDEIRRALRYPDAAGRVRALYSTAFTLRREGAYIVAEGSGWGHGLGLCQWGARGMAVAGRRYVEILTHYFPGTEVTTPMAHSGQGSEQHQ